MLIIVILLVMFDNVKTPVLALKLWVQVPLTVGTPALQPLVFELRVIVALPPLATGEPGTPLAVVFESLDVKAIV